ncbi:phosphocholine cytidylyltransferase family protein [Archaeoglobus veneficus]|uniref:Nucleotidyl transferase n=1 Tax=Archaeoglobus veneficus (strain DSM 11195 / SNP6) TaxID=693661 RepID=F2KNW4_ARCVS|nr:phosphocholine cytidylyltransferase family protein [Archaeoglobus veneficus]AEA47441.1 Nucleotidyl transferase [Archaeoglobus veneficus SNP6]
MKAVILAAGMGRRLGEHSGGVPKPLVEVNEKPVLAYTLTSLVNEGIHDVIIVTGYNASAVRKFVSTFSDLNVRYVHNERYDETNNIYSVYLAKREVDGRSFLLLNSDVLFHPGILRALIKSEKEGVVLSVDFKKELGEEEMKVRVEDGRILEISKEIPPEKADGEYIGLTRIDSKYSSAFFDAVENVLQTAGSGVFYEEAFQRMIDDGKMLTFEDTEGLPWIEIDTPEDLRVAREVVAPGIPDC